MNSCTRELANGEQCGLPEWTPNTRQCQFHSLGEVTATELPKWREYLSQTRSRGHVDCSHMTFKRFTFTKTDLEIISSRPVNFNYSVFRDCDFKSFKTKSDVSFFNGTFEETRFRDIEFGGQKVIFIGARFEGIAIPFGNCIFSSSEEVRFGQSKSSNDMSPFSRCFITTKKLDFEDAYIMADRFYLMATDKSNPVYSDSHLVINASEIYFDGMTLDGHFVFTNGPNNQTPSPYLSFSIINFSHMRSASFMNANLERARFVYSKIDDVYFANVKWKKKRGRLIIHDEVSRVEKHDLEDIQRVYVQLKKNYEENRDFRNAGDWHYREMEIGRKLIARHSWRPYTILRQYIFSFYPWYWVASKYGESYMWPLGWMAILFVVFAYVYYSLSVEFVKVPFIMSFSDALKYSLLVMSLQHKGIQDNIFQNMPVITATQIILTAIIVSLFLLALRRKFKR